MTTPSPSLEFIQYPPVYVQRHLTIGNRLVIIGESDKGELYDPMLIYDKQMAEDFFGEGQLVNSYNDANTFQEGISIFLMRIEPNGHEVAYSILEALDFDLLFIPDIHFDIEDDRDNLDKFINLARIKESKGNLIHGITTLSPDLNYEDLKNIFDDILNLTTYAGDETYEKGKYLSVVVDQGEFQDAGAVYAGMLASTSPEISPINKRIPEFTLNMEFSKDEILMFRAIGIVCFKNTFKNGVTCTSSSCAVSTEGSVHKHISNFRIAQALIGQISNELHQFIGMPHVMLKAQHVETVVNAVCTEHIGLERIRDYDYEIGVRELYGIINLDIEIVPIYSVHRMATHTQIRVFM